MSELRNVSNNVPKAADKNGCATPVAVNRQVSKDKDVSVPAHKEDVGSDSEKTKADMEKELSELSKKPGCTADEMKRFSYLVNHLSANGNSFNNCSVLMSAVMSNNVEVVVALVERFRALFYTRNQQQESLLHLACKSMSNLRYYYVTRCPALLTGPDTNGTLPLHIASENNDIEFISWLFKCVLQPESIEDTLSMPYIEDEYSDETYSFHANSLEHIRRFSSPSLEIAKNTKLLATTVSKNTALHAAIQNGHHELLAMLLKVVVSLPVETNLSIILDRKTFNQGTPIDIAIFKQQPKCLRVLLEFLESNNLLKTLMTDEGEQILRDAVVSEDIEVLKVLLQFGFHRGIEKAISIASARQSRGILRLLLHYYTLLTQIKDTEAFVAAHRSSTISSVLTWKGLMIEEIYPELLGDACHAITSSSQPRPRHSRDKSLYNLDPIRSLALECLEYFNGIDLTASSSSSWYTITEVDLSDNNLNNVPPELFQLPSIHTLSLAQNALKTLPTSNSPTPESTTYTSQRLKTLVLDCNQLQTLPEDMIYGLVNCLEELSIQMNQLDSLPPGIWIMPKLKKICLSQNKLYQMHYFDHEKYFKDTDFSTKVVTNLASGDEKNVKSKSVLKYLLRLRMFCHTLHKVEGEEFEEAAFIQGVLLLHQQRLTQDKMGSLYSSKLYKLLYASSENELLKTNAGKLSALTHLDLSHNKFSKFPQCIPCLAPHLQRLDMRSNRIECLNLVRSFPPSIITILLGSNSIHTVWQPSKDLGELCMSPHMLLLPQTGIQHLCVKHSGLEHLTALHLNNNCLETVFGDFEDFENSEQVQRPLGKVFPRLSILSLEHNSLKSLIHFHQLSSLNSLDLSFNTFLEALPLEFGVLSLSVLKLDGLKLHGIPTNLSTPKLLKYLKNMLNDAKPYRHMKLVAVGNTGSGKTTLLQQLTKQGKMVRRQCHTFSDDLSTTTINPDFMEWKYAPRSQKKVTFTTWDFGGQSEYFTVYQCFLTHRSLYLVIWNVADGEQGLRDLQPWLENIEARAPGSPVIVIGTHGDCGNGAYEGLEKLFKELYINYNASRFAYPQFIHHQCIIVSSFDSTQINHLRKSIYEVASSYKPAGLGRRKSTLPMLADSVPYFYIQLHEIVKGLAHKCYEEGIVPIYTDQEYRQAVQLQCDLLQQQGKPANTDSGKVGFSSSQLREASFFLHNDGMILQYTDTAKNEYIYCVNPQWLCTTLSRVISESQKNARFKNGFVYREDVQDIFSITFSGKNIRFISELGKFMEKLEVILSLDADRVLIPSFLPQTEDNACLILQERDQLGTNLVEKNEDISLSLISFSLVTLEQRSLMRYYILPFIPHDFFPRLIARVTGSSVLKEFGNRLSNFITSNQKLEGTLNWLCWKNGIKCVWNHLEILTIAPVAITVAGTRITYIISSSGPCKVERQHGIEISVTVLPQETFNSKLDAIPTIASSLATWLLQQAVLYVESVFNDWYEAFGRSRGFELSLINSASPCPLCHSVTVSNKAAQGSEETQRYIFSSIYCARAVTENKELVCPIHGTVPMIDVAPDLMFYDCYPSLVVSSKSVVAKQRIGDGGFGTVYSGAIISEERRTDIAIKEFSPQNVTDEEPEHQAELVAWEKYQNASQEARTMVRLNHENVLRLMGITLTPMRLLLELAPLGDLKSSVEKFKSANTRFNRRTLTAIMTQIAGALHHLHSHSIIYQDLKPGNVLLWQFPRPETQWDNDSVIHVKLADYGVCQLDNPQGVKGIQGTPAYLPPEVLLQGGQQSHNTKLDVYSFGMFLYFLFTFSNPFEKEIRPVAFLLEEGKRPEFSSQHHPSSLWMLELMCWCWSEHPQDRPNFKEILNLLRDDTLTQLISAIPITEGGEEVTAACTRLGERKADTSIAPSGMMYGSLDVHFPIPSLPLLPQSPQVSMPQNNSYLEVWHGTDGGDVKILQYLPAGCIIEVNVTTLKSYISSICIVDENVWVATLGDGIHAFDANTKERLTQWQAKQANNYVHVLHYCSSRACVVALEDAYLHVFSSVINMSEQNGAFNLTLLHSVAISCQSTLAHISGPEDREEIWTATQRGTQIIVFNLNTRSMESVLDQSARGGFKLRVIEPLNEAGENDYVAISDGHYLEKWSVLHRKKELEINCHKICTQFTEQRHSIVVSLLALGGVLYAGTEGGIILVLSSSFSVLSTLHACFKLNRYLLGVKSAQNITLISKQFSLSSRGKIKRQKKSPSTDSTQETQIASRPSYFFTLPANITNRNIVISFGHYFEVSSKSSNRPPKLQLPAQPSSEAGSNEIFVSRAKKQSSHMLLWSGWNLKGQSDAEKSS